LPQSTTLNSTYTDFCKRSIEKFGHPRLRMRHIPFSIGRVERDQWIWCMNKALDESHIDPRAIEYLKKHLAESADFLRNRRE